MTNFKKSGSIMKGDKPYVAGGKITLCNSFSAVIKLIIFKSFWRLDDLLVGFVFLSGFYDELLQPSVC